MTGLCSDRNPRNRGMSCSLPPGHASPHAMGDDGGTWPIVDPPSTETARELRSPSRSEVSFRAVPIIGPPLRPASFAPEVVLTIGGHELPPPMVTREPAPQRFDPHRHHPLGRGSLLGSAARSHQVSLHLAAPSSPPSATACLRTPPAWRLVERSGLSRDGDDFAVGTAHPESGNRAEVRVDDDVKVVVLHLRRVRPFPPETRPPS